MSVNKARPSVRRMLVVSSIVMTALVMISALSAPVSAGSGPLVVRGYISDSEGYKEAGAEVVINIRHAGTDAIRATLDDTTDDDGLYRVTFGFTDWDLGDRIEVISTWQGHVATNSTTATDAPIQWVNVTYGYVIPEFGGLGLVIVSFSVIALFLLASRTRRRL